MKIRCALTLKQTKQGSAVPGEVGAVLLMTLIFLTVIGVVGGALISGEVTTTRQSFSTRKVQTRETATNSGLEWAVNSLRQGKDGFCQGTFTSKILVIDNREVEVTCKGSPSANTGANTFALYLTANSPAAQNIIGTSGAVGATTVKNIVGPVYNAGAWDLHAPLKIDGDVLVPPSVSCSAAGTAPLPTNLVPLYNTVKCSTVDISVVTPTVPIPAPCSPLNACKDPAPTDLPSGCRVFSPGYYASAPELAGNNYFAPGTYYFDFNKVWNVGSAVRAGDPFPAGLVPNSNIDQVLSSIPACVGKPAAQPPYGVTFVFGKTAALNIGNNGRMELFTNVNGTTRLPNIVDGKYVGLPAWAADSTLPLAKDLVSVGVAQPQFILHSGVFAPDSGISLKGSNEAIELISNTVVLARFEMFASASITTSNFGVIVPAGGEKKYVLMARSCPGSLKGLTANACTTPFTGSAANPAEPQLCTVASLVIYNDSQRTVDIDNWRVDRDASASDPATCDPTYTAP
jgi:hypothetical protein